MRPPRQALILLASGLAAVCLAGCGLTDPYPTDARSSTRASTTASTSSDRRPSTPASEALDPRAERGGSIPPRQQADQRRVDAAAGSATARRAVIRYAILYVNWRARSLVAHERRLAGVSIGAARLAALQQAASAPTDPTLTANQVANHGQVISAEPGIGPTAGRWVIVTREQTTGQGSYRGLPAQLHVTYAITTRTRNGWLISQWSPQT